MHDRILHRHLQSAALAGRLFSYSAPRTLIAISMPVPVSPIVQPGLTGGCPVSPVTLIVPPQACAIMSKARISRTGCPRRSP